MVNYAPLTVGGALILFGGWWVLSAKNWFQGPVRQGDEEDLERIEAELACGADSLPGEDLAQRAAQREAAVEELGAAGRPRGRASTPSSWRSGHAGTPEGKRLHAPAFLDGIASTARRAATTCSPSTST